MKNKNLTKVFSFFSAAVIIASLSACNNSSALTGTDLNAYAEEPVNSAEPLSAEDGSGKTDIADSKMTSSEDGEHVIEADGETKEYSNVKITKTGDSDAGDEADFYGDNSAVFAANGAVLSLNEMVIDTDGKHANAVFSYGDGTIVNVEDSVINTSGDCSGGLMTTGGGTMNASNLSVHTTGNSSAAIRSDRGGGTVIVTGGNYTTDGMGSPAIYSTADITVNDSVLSSTSSQGIVVEGQNSVTLNNVDLTADNNTKNSDKSDYYQAVMIYQSMSGDADEGTAKFTMDGGSIVNKNGDVFFVNNTVADVSLSRTQIINKDADGVLLRAQAAGWGSEGTNGGNVNFTITGQTLEGDIIVDEISALNYYLKGASSYSGTINPEKEGNVYVEIEEGSVWDLTDDSFITSLTCSESSIRLNGHKLYVNGKEYTEGTSSVGNESEFIVSAKEHGGPDKTGKPGEDGGNPPEKPDGNGGHGQS